MQSYKDLEIYQLAHRGAVEVHELTLRQLPAFEQWEEARQIRRSSKSVAAAIVEGFGRKHYQQEYVRYLTYALASCDETKEHLELLFDTGSLTSQAVFRRLLAHYDCLGRKLHQFRAAVRRNL